VNLGMGPHARTGRNGAPIVVSFDARPGLRFFDSA
jgi:hypothetical protein